MRGKWSLARRVTSATSAVALVAACGARSVPELTCPSGQAPCTDACATLAADPQNCGACGNVCPSGTVCFAGACATSCGAGTTQCGQSCRDTDVDPHNCGACDVGCPSGNACVSGACTSTCAKGQTLCTADAGAYCASANSDNVNCGACGHACAAGTTCVSGACVNQCAAGLSACGSACVDLSSDLSNCGACGQVCTACISGRCVTEIAATATLVPIGGVTVNAKGVYWTDAHGVYRADTSGNPASAAWVANSFGSYGIASNPTGPVVWAVTTNSPQYGQIGFLDGQSVSYVATARPWAVALDANDAYWVAEDGVVRGLALGTSTPWTIASGETPVNHSPHNIATDGTSVFWLDQTYGAVRAAPAKPSDAGAAETVFTGLILPWILAVDSTYLYWTAGDVWRGPKDGSAQPTIVGSTVSGAQNLAIDASNVYFVDYGGVERAPLGGGAVTTLVDASIFGGGPGSNSVDIAVDASAVYWTVGSNNNGASIWRATLLP